MRTVKIVRDESTDEGTFGILTTDSGFTCLSGELPDRDNQSGKSCIPKGTYVCRWRESPKHGMCYHVDGVEGRTDIEVHSANLMGDVEKGFVSQLLGCIALGVSKSTFAPGSVPELRCDQKGIAASKQAVSDFVDDLNQEEFQLTIE